VIDDFIRRIPKAELHVHIEGTLEPRLAFDLARRNGLTLPYASPGELRAAYCFESLQQFLDLYYEGVDVLRGRDDFRELTAAYAQRAIADGARHVEVMFDPQSHVPRGVPLEDVVGGMSDALAAAERDHDLSWRLIMCFLRDRGPAGAEEYLEMVKPFRDVVVAVGLDSAERGHAPQEFAAVFAAARAAGFATVAHAGEEGPAAYVREALGALQVRRIDHGVHAADDPVLVRRLADGAVPLTMCPLSNVELKVTPDLRQHPLKRLLDAGVPVTVNSDDPAYFGGYLADNYIAARHALGLTCADIVALARNSIAAAFVGEARREQLLEELEDFVSGHGEMCD
jgi:adenosine deaminase